MENDRLTVRDFKQRLMKESEEKKVLLSANVEITSICNFKCPHCYNENVERGYMPLESFQRIMNELKNLGCVYLTITGGEPLLHPQFEEIYKRTHKAGFIVSLFSNGYIIDNYLELLSRYKPYEVDISLYGIDDESYLINTGIINGKKVINNLELLEKKGITFSLKTVVTRNLLPYIEQMRLIAHTHNATFRLDAYVYLSPLQAKNVERLTAKEIAELLLKSNEYVELERKALIERSSCIGEQLYNCRPGENNIFITWDENVKMCPFGSEEHSCNIKGGKSSIEDARRYLQKIGELKWPKDKKCINCKYLTTCRKCPERFYVESGSYYDPTDWMCETAKCIYERIQDDVGE
nr:radical SAM protein [uncultured Acetatifactor sp.]